MNNNQRRTIKAQAKSLIEFKTNNKVISSKVISEERVECTCKNKFSQEHLITVILGNRANYIIYDGGIISVDYAKEARKKEV